MDRFMSENLHPDTPNESGLSLRQQKRGMRLIYPTAMAFSVSVVLLIKSSLGALLIKSLGGTDVQSVLPGVILSFGGFLQLIIAVRMPPARGRAFLHRMVGLSLALYALAFLSPFVLPSGPGWTWCFLALLTTALLIRCAGSTFWMPLLHDIVPPNFRGRFFGRLRSLWTTGSLLVVWAGGWFVGENPEPWRYQVVFLFGTALIGVGLAILRHVPDGRNFHGDAREFDHWVHYVRNLLHHRRLTIFLGYYFALGFCIGILTSPLVLYMNHRGFPADSNVYIFSAMIVGQIAAFAIAGILVDRIGTKRVFQATHLVLCVVCFALLGIAALPNDQAKWLFPLALAVSGSMMAASSVACTAHVFHLVPDRGRAFNISLSSIIMLNAPMLSPLIISMLFELAPPAEPHLGPLDTYQIVLLAGGVLMLLSMGLLRWVQTVHPNRDG